MFFARKSLSIDEIFSNFEDKIKLWSFIFKWQTASETKQFLATNKDFDL